MIRGGLLSLEKTRFLPGVELKTPVIWGKGIEVVYDGLKEAGGLPYDSEVDKKKPE